MTNLLVIKSVRQDGALSSSHWQLKGVGEVVVTLTLVGEVGELVGVEEGHAVADEQLYKQSRNNQENYKERKVMSKITWKQRSSSDGEQSKRSPTSSSVPPRRPRPPGGCGLGRSRRSCGCCNRPGRWPCQIRSTSQQNSPSLSFYPRRRLSRGLRSSSSYTTSSNPNLPLSPWDRGRTRW